MPPTRTGILFVHGIVGNNRIFDFLAPLVPDHCEVLRLVLPGHGGDALAFSRSSLAQWRRSVTLAVAALRSRCSRVFAVAHSMGCLFVLDEALQGKLDGLLLLNAPLRVHVAARALVNVLKVGAGRGHGDPVTEAAREAYGISLDYNPLHYYGWPRRYAELFGEIRRVRRLIGERGSACPVELVFGGRDELVSPRAASPFEPYENCRVTVLPDAGHYYYPADDRSVIGRRFENLINNG